MIKNEFRNIETFEHEKRVFVFFKFLFDVILKQIVFLNFSNDIFVFIFLFSFDLKNFEIVDNSLHVCKIFICCFFLNTFFILLNISDFFFKNFFDFEFFFF